MADYVVQITDPNSFEGNEVSRVIYERVCRTDFSRPGFALVKLPASETSEGLRHKMVALKERLSSIHAQRAGKRLGWFNMTRFDQKNTTKPHRDGAPAESLLILGYEPSAVKSKITMADYSKCAHDLGISPDQFLEDYNPMFEKGLQQLAPLTVELTEFDNSIFQILLINNSSKAMVHGEQKWQGVLHSATVSADEGSRVINSTCVAPLGAGEPEMIDTEAALAKFFEDVAVAGGYK